MRPFSAFAICFVLAAHTAAAQTPQTREEALRQEREAKAAALEPNELNPLQRGMALVEERGLFMIARDGFHPKIGRLTTGSGMALGVGWRNRDIFKRYGTLEAFTAASFQKYWAMEARATFPDLARGRIVADAVATLREYPQESFYGIGPDSRKRDETNFMLRTALVGGRAGVKLGPLTTIGGGLERLSPRVGRGRDEQLPPMETFPNVAAVPGFMGRADYVRSSAFVEFDYREPKNARQGGFYRVERSHYGDRSSSRLTFNRTDIDLRQYLGFFAGRRVIALRGVLSTTDAAEGNDVPFYLMPFLGGKDRLRGFRNYRFRGPHALLLQGEYRWEVWSGLEGALFYDAGKVTIERRDLSLKGLEHAYGFGFRFNTDNAVVLRFDAAFGSRDGKRLHMALGGVF
jgi:hypothetical protein